MNCEYSHNCGNSATHLMNTKIGDFYICVEHAETVQHNKFVRYIEPLYKSVLDRISEPVSI